MTIRKLTRRLFSMNAKNLDISKLNTPRWRKMDTRRVGLEKIKMSSFTHEIIMMNPLVKITNIRFFL